MASLTGLGELSTLATTAINKIWPDKSEQEKQELAAAVMVVQGQIDINREEAKHPSVFVSGWRPGLGWVCVAAFAFQFVIYPTLTFGATFLNSPIPPMPTLDDNLWELLFGMLGLGGLRTFEKIKKVASK